MEGRVMEGKSRVKKTASKKSSPKLQEYFAGLVNTEPPTLAKKYYSDGNLLVKGTPITTVTTGYLKSTTFRFFHRNGQRNSFYFTVTTGGVLTEGFIKEIFSLEAHLVTPLFYCYKSQEDEDMFGISKTPFLFRGKSHHFCMYGVFEFDDKRHAFDQEYMAHAFNRWGDDPKFKWYIAFEKRGYALLIGKVGKEAVFAVMEVACDGKRNLVLHMDEYFDRNPGSESRFIYRKTRIKIV